MTKNPSEKPIPNLCPICSLVELDPWEKVCAFCKGEGKKLPYKFPLIGVGEAAQTHLRRDDVAKVEPIKKTMRCKEHGEHQGTFIAGNWVAKCPVCIEGKRRKNFKAHYSRSMSIQVADWVLAYWRERAAEQGKTVEECVQGALAETIPAEWVKKYLMGKA